MNLSKLFLLFSFLSFSVCLVGNEPKVQTKFKIYSLGKAEDLYYKSSNQYESVFVPNNKRSGYFKYSGGLEMSFYKKEAEQYIQVGSTDLLPESKNAFIVLYPIIKNGKIDNYKFYAIEEPENQGMDSKWLILNLTGRNLITKKETNIVPLAIDMKKQRFVQNKNQAVSSHQFQVFEKNDSEMLLLYNATWPYKADKKVIVFLLPRSGNSAGIRVKNFFE